MWASENSACFIRGPPYSKDCSARGYIRVVLLLGTRYVPQPYDSPRKASFHSIVHFLFNPSTGRNCEPWSLNFKPEPLTQNPTPDHPRAPKRQKGRSSMRLGEEFSVKFMQVPRVSGGYGDEGFKLTVLRSQQENLRILQGFSGRCTIETQTVCCCSSLHIVLK